MSVLLNNPLNVPIRVDAIWSDGKTLLAPPIATFSQIQRTIPEPSENFSHASPWLGDTIVPELSSLCPLPQGLHLHWTLPDALQRGTTVYTLNYSVYNELIEQGVPWSLVQALQSKIPNNTEYTFEGFQYLLKSLAADSKILLNDSDFLNFKFDSSSQPLAYQLLISSDPAVCVYSCYPSFNWDQIFLEIYAPLIIKTAAHMKLPPVPNRWLVVRKDDASSQAWVVESDRLITPNPDGTAPAGAGPTAIPAKLKFKNDFKLNLKYDNGDSSESVPVTLQNISRSTFLYLGLKTPASQWSEPGSTVQALTPLTATGYGLLDFAAYYPNCQGVFGFFDDTADPNTEYTYTIIGWFSDSSQDPASISYAVTPWSVVSDISQRIQTLLWDLNGEASGQDGSVYTASITVTGKNCLAQSSATLDKVKVSIGNTAGEALAAYLANSDTTSQALGLSKESFLDAAQAGILNNILEPDGSAVIENTLHQHSFQPASHDSIWVIKPVSQNNVGLSQTQQNQPSTSSITDLQLPQELADDLNTLNSAQIRFDCIQAYMRSQRRLLFTDWCRVLHLATDASGTTDITPNAVTLNPFQKTNIQNVGVEILNNTSRAVDAAGMGASKNAGNLLTYQAAKNLYLALKKILSSAVFAGKWQLKRQPAPRFWTPNDPVILMTDSNNQSSLEATPASNLPKTQINGKSFLNCTVINSSSSKLPSPTYLPQNWSAGPSATCIATLVSNVFDAAKNPQMVSSWRPLMLLWEANFYPYPNTGGIYPCPNTSGILNTSNQTYQVQDYSPDFITKQFTPDPQGIDLIPKTGIVPNDSSCAIYSGRVVLSKHAVQALQERVLVLANQTTKKPWPEKLDANSLPGPLSQGDAASLITNAYTNASGITTLAQTLDGFHDRLLMLRRIPQISIFDPNYANSAWYSSPNTNAVWNQDLQSFYSEIGIQDTASPHHDDIYNPIRAGKCELTTLWLIDAFGQIKTWSMDTGTVNTVIAQSLPNMTDDKVENAAPAFLLSPRLAQASRLLFRWIAADAQGEVETNSHPATSPICGWLALNRVDENILVFNADGSLVGWISINDTNKTLTPAPGSNAAINDPFLQQVVTQIESNSKSFFDDIDTALLTIEPRSHQQHTAKSVLVSRPLALARVSLKLETLGTPAPHQGYEWLVTTNLNTPDPHCPNLTGTASPFYERETCGFTKVEFPLRLGDVSMDNDGLAAYWHLSNAKGNWTLNGNYLMVSSDPSNNSANCPEPTINLTCDPSAPATQVLLLFDPRAPVHATSGILPVKAIDLPPDYYNDAIRNMQYIMTVGPVLMPPDQIQLPLPTEVSGQWNWLEEVDGKLNLIAQGATRSNGSHAFTGKVDDRAHLTTTPPVMRNGWLQVKLNGS